MRFVVHDSGKCLGWASKSLLPQTILGFCYKTVFCKEKVTNSPAGKRGRGEQRNVPNIFLSIVCTGPAFLDSTGYSPEAGARSCCSKCRIRKGAGAAGVHGHYSCSKESKAHREILEGHWGVLFSAWAEEQRP